MMNMSEISDKFGDKFALEDSRELDSRELDSREYEYNVVCKPKNSSDKFFEISKRQRDLLNFDEDVIESKHDMFVDVYADEITDREIRFECPFCYASYKKNGEPRQNGKRLVHMHHSGGDLSNRVTTRNPHCIQNYIKNTQNFPKDKSGFRIHVTSSTKRARCSKNVHHIEDLRERKLHATMISHGYIKNK